MSVTHQLTIHRKALSYLLAKEHYQIDMQSVKSLKSIAVNNPRRIGKTENHCAVKHHLLRSDGTEQAFTADAIVKLANPDLHAA